MRTDDYNHILMSLLVPSYHITYYIREVGLLTYWLTSSTYQGACDEIEPFEELSIEMLIDEAGEMHLPASNISNTPYITTTSD